MTEAVLDPKRLPDRPDDSLDGEAGLGIAAVEQETGVSKDLLRIWERRYGFPTPARNGQGERLYPHSQVRKLRLVRRLLDRGERPRHLLPMSMDALEALAGAGPQIAPREAFHDLVIFLLKTHQTTELRRELSQAVMRDGLFRFVSEICAPLSALIGEAWMRGEIRIFEEHLFTEQMQGVLRGAIAQIPGAGGTPRVLLTTLPSEHHGLGLLMAEAMFALEGADCLSLGVQTPVSDIVDAAQARQADLVALSFTGSFPLNQMLDSLSLLRERLPPQTGLWCGGHGVARARQLPEGVHRIEHLSGIREALMWWRERTPEPGSR